MAEYISREAVEQVLCGMANGLSVGETEALKTKDVKALYKIKGAKEILNAIDNDLSFIPAADVQPVDRWISVDDKLPDTVDDCLVWYSCDTAFGKSKSVGISFCSRNDWYTKHLNGDNIVVLYWMPLPEPPKDGDVE